MRNYNSIDVGYPYVIRGTNQQTQTGLLWATPTYRTHQRGGTPTNLTNYLPGLRLGKYALHNRSGSAVVCGIGVRIPNDLWIAGQWTNATTTYTDDTTDAQDAGADDVALETTTTNDGYIIASRVRFNAVSINVGTADTGTAPVRAVRFSTAAGTGWQTAESNLFIQSGSAAAYSTGEQVVVFAPPVDWGKSSGLATNLRDGFYAMNVRSTTAPGTTGATATAIEVFRFYELQEAVADNSTLLDDFFGGDLLMAQDETEGLYGDALVALFGTANDQNRVTAQVRAA